MLESLELIKNEIEHILNQMKYNETSEVKMDDITIRTNFGKNEKYIIIEQGEDIVVLSVNQVNKICDMINEE